jgi:Lon protease-like protein
LSTEAEGSGLRESIALFPLQSVLFPGGLLNLKVFETRYLDLVSDCLRTGTGFGVVCLRQGGEVQRAGEAIRFEGTGVLASVDEVDSEQTGILKVKCIGGRRFRIANPRQQAYGLWQAEVAWLPDDVVLAPTPALTPAVRALANAIATLKQQGAKPFLPPYRFDDAGWVANRWCELLPVSLAAKQKLMELDEPLVRLQLVDEFLRSKGVIS